jgi:ubiquinone/menaquinone biosynthesis C-methylase UbiE
MPIEYQETAKDLNARIDIHTRYGARDIDAWMLDLLKPAPGIRLLDVGCGGGKQCRLFAEALRGEAAIVGGDISPELLAQARQASREMGGKFLVEELDFNRRFPFPDESFDLLTCCFAIYYAADPGFTLDEMRRVLRPGGRVFTTGPLPGNKSLFYEIIRTATGREIPSMPGSSRYESQILPAMRARFSRVEVHRFENPLVFPEVEPFLDYTRASLSEDRKLWAGLFRGSAEFDRVMAAIESEARKRLAGGPLVMTKVVGGFLATR